MRLNLTRADCNRLAGFYGQLRCRAPWAEAWYGREAAAAETSILALNGLLGALAGEGLFLAQRVQGLGNRLEPFPRDRFAAAL